MAASATHRRINEVLASAREELKAQLGVVRAEIALLAAEEQELTAALASLKADGPSSSATRGTGKRQSRSPASKAKAAKTTVRDADAKRSRKRGTSKSTAERTQELRVLLAEGPKSRSDLAAALKVSPARVQQLLASLGASVRSRPAPDKRSKLWSIQGASNGASGPNPQQRGGRRQAGRSSAAKPRARKAATAMSRMLL